MNALLYVQRYNLFDSRQKFIRSEQIFIWSKDILFKSKKFCFIETKYFLTSKNLFRTNNFFDSFKYFPIKYIHIETFGIFRSMIIWNFHNGNWKISNRLNQQVFKILDFFFIREGRMTNLRPNGCSANLFSFKMTNYSITIIKIMVKLLR